MLTSIIHMTFDCKYQNFTEEHFLLDGSISRAISLSTATQSAKELVPLFVDLYQREADGEDFVPALKAIISKNRLESYPFNKVKIEDFLGDKEGYFNSLTTMNR